MNSVNIFLHIPRTAGTTIVRHIEKNYKTEERLPLYPKSLGILSKKRTKYSRADYKKIINKYIASKSPKELRKIKIIYGHYVPYGVEKLLKRKANYITVFRDPLKRSESLYNFWATSYYSEKKKGRLRKIYKYGFLVKGKQVDYCKWLKSNYTTENYANFAVSLEKYLYGLGYIGATDKKIMDRLDKFKFLGMTDNSREDFLYIYYLLGIKKFYTSVNKSKKYVQEKKCEPRKIIKANSKDFLIYSLAKSRNEKSKYEINNFKKIVRHTKLKKTFSKAIIRDFYSRIIG